MQKIILRRRASAVWEGSLQEGVGSLSATSGVLNSTPYSFKTRLVSEDGKAGTNPEELLAAAHAGCFTMSVSAGLGQAGFVAESLTCRSELVMDTDTLSIIAETLTLTGKVPNIDKAQFLEIAEHAKVSCIISKALSPGIEISLDVKLV